MHFARVKTCLRRTCNIVTAYIATAQVTGRHVRNCFIPDTFMEKKKKMQIWSGLEFPFASPSLDNDAIHSSKQGP